MSCVHSTHCCTYGCKYGDKDCPVATGTIEPEYPCEDCHCKVFYPKLHEEANQWWNNLTDEEKSRVYFHEKNYC